MNDLNQINLYHTEEIFVIQAYQRRLFLTEVFIVFLQINYFLTDKETKNRGFSRKALINFFSFV